MATLPLILAGPIVRRVELGRVAVWVALSVPARVELHVFDGVLLKSNGAGTVDNVTRLVKGEAGTIRCGDRLFIAVIETRGTVAKPHDDTLMNPPLLAGKVYSYDIVVRPLDEPTQAIGLRDLGLLEDDPVDEGGPRHIAGMCTNAPQHYALGYGTDVLPSFVTPAAEIAQVRLAHCSCRKIHGPGTDALSYLDELIEDNIDNPAERLQQLYLTGDQIYGDDVPATGLPMIHDLAMDLLTKEDVEAKEGEEEITASNGQVQRVNMATAPPLCRSTILRTDVGFTSTGTSNHLITFGEYCALYLLHWSPRVWRLLANDARVFEFSDIEDPDTPASALNRTRLAALLMPKGETQLHGAAFQERAREAFSGHLARERQSIAVFAATVGKVARVLANTPTYMIFDDHDVTDDWNINGAFQTRVYDNPERPAGRQVVRNALLAYTMFQGLGNDWSRFFAPDDPANPAEPKERPNVDFLPVATEYLMEVRGRSAATAAKLDRLFGFPGTDGPRMVFHFSVPALCHSVRVLDSRTRRGFERLGGYEPASLLGSSLGEQVPEHATSNEAFLLVVAATPVLGPELFARIALPALIIRRDMHRMSSDFHPQSVEAAPAENNENLDAKIEYYLRLRTRGALEMDQETWSSNPAAQHELLRRLAGHRRVVILGGDVHFGTNMMLDMWSRQDGNPAPILTARMAQLTSSAARNAFDKRVEAVADGLQMVNALIAGPVVSGLGWLHGGRVEPATDVTLPRALKLKEKPAILSAEGWSEGARLEDPLPDWWFELSGVTDVTPDHERPTHIQEAALELQPQFDAMAGLPPGLALAARVATAHAASLDKRIAPQRVAVFGNNVGVIKFEKLSGYDFAVEHTLISSEERGYPEDRPSAEVPMAPPDETADPLDRNNHPEVIPRSLTENEPFGLHANISAGAENTRVRIELTPPPLRDPALNREMP